MPSLVRYGQRYGDDSGWERLLEIDTQWHDGKVTIEMTGSECRMTCEELRWLVIAAIKAGDVLGWDKIVPEAASLPDGYASFE